MKKLTILGAALALHAAAAGATEIVYTPVNPSFGGSPLNGPVLLNSANAQNKHKDPAAATFQGLTQRSQLDLFNERLKGLILERLATSLSSGLFDNSGNLQPGTVETSSFLISIVDLGGGRLSVTTVDKATGASSSFEISTMP